MTNPREAGRKSNAVDGRGNPFGAAVGAQPEIRGVATARTRDANQEIIGVATPHRTRRRGQEPTAASAGIPSLTWSTEPMGCLHPANPHEVPPESFIDSLFNVDQSLTYGQLEWLRKNGRSRPKLGER